MTYLESIRNALHQALGANERVVVLGEDIVDPYGGAFKATKGLSTDFPKRVLSTPICEGGFTGIAAGLALRGHRPVVEIMFGDFLTLCTDQIVNHIAKFEAMYNRQVKVPLVIRTPMGGGRGYGPTHSQSLEKMFLGVPGLRVCAPSHVHDAGEILKHAVLEGDTPLIFVEHKLLYPLARNQFTEALSITTEPEIAGMPTVVARNFKHGKADISIIAYGGLSRMILPLMKQLADEEILISCALPASLSPLPVETLCRVAAESGRVLVIEEGTVGFNWGSEVAAQLHENLFHQLKKPVARLASAAEAIPASRTLENQVLVNPGQIETAIMELMS